MPVANTDNGSGIATDTLIVGAGMAGLYSAWRLTRAGHQVRIVEQLGRIGGRLDTDHVVIRGVPVQTEEGGMRFMALPHVLVAHGTAASAYAQVR